MKRSLLPVLALLLLVSSAHAANGLVGEEHLAWLAMAVNLFGGLALFLLGLERMADDLKAAAGNRMQTVLSTLTTNRFTGVLTGGLVTAVIQSSSVTTVLVVGFVSAGLMTLGQSIGIIMGANIGSTVTAQIVAFKITEAALVLVAIGFLTTFIARNETRRRYGGILLGLGLIFFGMNIMGDAMSPLRSYQPFLNLMAQLDNRLLGIVVGMLFTALVQSSAATTGIVILMAGQGFIPLPAGIALALGADIGTCATALLATLGKPRAGLRAAAFHVLFNVIGVLLWFGFIDQLALVASWLSPQHPELSDGLRLGAEVPRQIANANTLFKLTNTLIFLPFVPLISRLLAHLLPDREPSTMFIVTPRYLNSSLEKTPSLALAMVRLEIGHLGEWILTMLADTRRALQTRDLQLFANVTKQDDAADILHAAIIASLNRIGKEELTEAESAEFFQLTHAADNLESVGDILETELSGLGLKMVNDNMEPSEIALTLLDTLYDVVYQALESAITAVRDNDRRAAQEVVALKGVVDNLVQAAFHRQSASLAASHDTRLQTLRMEFEVTDRMKQIFSLAKRIARLVCPKEV